MGDDRAAFMTAGARTGAQYPEVVAVVMASAASDYMAMAIARSLRDIAAALIVDEEVPGRRNAVVSVHGVLRP